MLESRYQAGLIQRIRDLLPGCFILKNDSSYMQGVPDLLILWEDRWAMLEVKKDGRSRTQPNQEWYVDVLNGMSFAAFIYPGNEEEVLDALQHTFSTRRKTRVSQR